MHRACSKFTYLVQLLTDYHLQHMFFQLFCMFYLIKFVFYYLIVYLCTVYNLSYVNLSSSVSSGGVLCFRSGGRLWLPGFSLGSALLEVGVSTLPSLCQCLGCCCQCAAARADVSFDGVSLPGSSVLSPLSFLLLGSCF